MVFGQTGSPRQALHRIVMSQDLTGKKGIKVSRMQPFRQLRFSCGLYDVSLSIISERRGEKRPYHDPLLAPMFLYLSFNLPTCLNRTNSKSLTSVSSDSTKGLLKALVRRKSLSYALDSSDIASAFILCLSRVHLLVDAAMCTLYVYMSKTLQTRWPA